MKEYSQNGYIDVTKLDPDSKREYSKLVGDDLFGNQKL
jgi:hypothetical protein